MLSHRQKSGVIRAWTTAGQLKEPYMIICADIGQNVIPNYDKVVETHYLIDPVPFLSDQYSLRQCITIYLNQKGFPYSHFDVGEVQRSGDPNVLMWLIKEDMEQIRPSDFDRTFTRIFSVEVGTLVESWEELINGLNGNGTRIETLKRLAPNDKPPVIRVRFKGGNSYIWTDSLPQPYRELPPELWDLHE